MATLGFACAGSIALGTLAACGASLAPDQESEVRRWAERELRCPPAEVRVIGRRRDRITVQGCGTTVRVNCPYRPGGYACEVSRRPVAPVRSLREEREQAEAARRRRSGTWETRAAADRDDRGRPRARLLLGPADVVAVHGGAQVALAVRLHEHAAVPGARCDAALTLTSARGSSPIEPARVEGRRAIYAIPREQWAAFVSAPPLAFELCGVLMHVGAQALRALRTFESMIAREREP